MGDLLKAYDATVRANKRVKRGVDNALIAAGRKIAERVDEAVESGEGQEVTKALYLVPHLMNILREMHATPEARRVAGIIEEQKGVGKVAHLRSVVASKVS